MICHGCQYKIEDNKWRYCKRCGTSTAQLQIPHLIPQAVAGSAGGNGTELEVVLGNSGFRPVIINKISLSEEPWVSCKIPTGPIEIQPDNSWRVPLMVAPPEDVQGSYRIELTISSNDSVRQDLWQTEAYSEQVIEIPIDVQQPQALQLESNLVIFSTEIQEREVTLLNWSATPVRLRNFQTVPGIEILVRQDQTWHALKDIMGQWQVPAAANPQNPGKGEVKLRVLSGEYLQLVHQMRSGSLPEVLLVDGRGNRSFIAVHALADHGSGEVVPYIVSIDFGTEHTAVYGRDPNQPDHIEPIPIFDAEEMEFYQVPSYIAYRRDGTGVPEIGRRAKRYAKEPIAFPHIESYRDVKLWLRSTEPDIQRRYNKVLIDFLKALRGEINKFLRSKPEFGGDIPDGVQYVITLPVLDNATHYHEQRERMREALFTVYGPDIRQFSLYPSNFTFVQEPQAAAAGFLLGQAHLQQMNPDFQPRPFKRDDLILVVDSGAGTTDVALVLVTDKTDYNKFEVLDTFGTAMGPAGPQSSKELREFGGRMIDRVVLDLACEAYARATNSAVLKPDSPEAATAAKSNLIQEAANLNGTTLTDENASKLETSILTWAEEAKKRLDHAESISFEETAPLMPDFPELQFFTVQRDELEKRVSPRLEDLIKYVKELLNNPALLARLQKLRPGQYNTASIFPSHVFAIGGTANMPVFEKHLKAHFGFESVVPLGELPPEYARRIRMQAVVQGGVWTFQAPIGNLMPYNLSRSINSMNGPKRVPTPILEENTAIMGQWKRTVRGEATVHYPFEFEICTTINGKDFSLYQTKLYDPGTHRLELEIDENWILTLADTWKGQKNTLWTYPVK